MVFTQKLLHTKAFTQRSLCTEAPLHEVTSWNWQQFFGKNPWQELSGTHLLPKKAVYFQQSSYSMTFFQFSKNIRNIFLKQVPVQKLSSPHCDEMEGREIRRSRRGASALKFGSAGSTRVACPTSVPERLELYGEARPKPPTLRRRAPKNTKNPSGGWGRAFWPESGLLISVSKSIPPPVLRVPKIGKKRRFDAFFGRFFAFRKAQNAVNCSIFAF